MMDVRSGARTHAGDDEDDDEGVHHRQHRVGQRCQQLAQALQLPEQQHDSDRPRRQDHPHRQAHGSQSHQRQPDHGQVQYQPPAHLTAVNVQEERGEREEGEERERRERRGSLLRLLPPSPLPTAAAGGAALEPEGQQAKPSFQDAGLAAKRFSSHSMMQADPAAPATLWRKENRPPNLGHGEHENKSMRAVKTSCWAPG